MGNKTANKQEGQRKKESERERLKRIPQKDQIVAFAHEWKTNIENYIRLVKKHAFFLGDLIFSHFYAN